MQVFQSRPARRPVLVPQRLERVPGMACAWLVSGERVALAMVNMPGHFVGWLGFVAGDLDASLLAALGVPALLYPRTSTISIQSPARYSGRRNSRGVPSTDSDVAPIAARIGHRTARGRHDPHTRASSAPTSGTPVQCTPAASRRYTSGTSTYFIDAISGTCAAEIADLLFDSGSGIGQPHRTVPLAQRQTACSPSPATRTSITSAVIMNLRTAPCHPLGADILATPSSRPDPR